VTDRPDRRGVWVGRAELPLLAPLVSQPYAEADHHLVTIFEGLHDMSRPADALRMARAMLSPSGSVVIADELVEDEFTAPASELERYHCGWSVVLCLPGVMGDPLTSATGAVMRSAMLRRYAQDAGFAGVEIPPIDSDTWRFYRLTQGSPA
jgi:hypothetical protein